MGEIATWSAVKTKVGLGKDSNECPTKAELLALSPTGTGENYVGLELTNASSYGNNETVQLSDIHKVTYRYAFTVVDTVLNFPALGGYHTPRGFGLGTTKQKQIDGVAIGDTISVGYTQSAYPDWIVYDEGYKASENTTLNQRSASLTFTQNESGKQITVQFTQDAGVETWEYTFSVQNSNLNYSALGGSATPEIVGYNSFKTRYVNGKPTGQVDVSFSSPTLPSWIFMDDRDHYTALENKSENSRSQVFTSTQNESGKKVTVTFTQAAGVKSYNNNVVITEPDWENLDIPASGGAWNRPVLTISQTWGWNGDVTNGGNYEVSGPSYYDFETGGVTNKPSLGTTQANRTKVAEVKVWVSFNKTTNQLVPKDSDNRTSYSKKTYQVYQAANQIESTTQGAWVVSIYANPSTFTEKGGTSQISASAGAPRTNHWSSGATNAASDATGTPTLSIPTAVTGFSLSGTTLTVFENTTPNDRSVVVRATMDTVYKEVTVTQSAYLVEWRYTLTTSTPTLNFDALGTTKSGTISSYREKYINGSLVEGSLEGVNIQVKSTSAEIQSATAAVAITMKENTTTQARTGTVVYEQVGSGKTVTITCSQAAGTVSTRDVLEVVDNFGDSPAVGGSIFGLVKSGYYDVINGKDSTWHNVTPTLKSKSSYITNVEITKASGDGYNIGITLSENTSESSRRASLTLTYGSKEANMATTQAGASVRYNYYFGVTTDFPSVAAAGATPKAVIKSRRHKVVNGVEESSYNLVETSVISKPNWTGTLSTKVSSTSGSGADYDVTIPVYENTEASIRRGTVVLQQGGSGKQITLNLNQLAASITTRDYINYVEPIPDGMFSALAQSITVTLQSYRETLINGKVTSKVAVQPDFDLDSTVTDWASVDLIGGNPTNYEYDFEVSVKENTTNQTRSGSVMFYNGAAEVENAWAFTQDAATVSTSYRFWWREVSNGVGDTTLRDNITDFTTSSNSHVSSSEPNYLMLCCDKLTTINGNTTGMVYPTWDAQSSFRFSGGIFDQASISAVRYDDGVDMGVNCLLILVRNGSDNLEVGSLEFLASLISPLGSLGTIPNLKVIVPPVPYTRIFEFSWKSEGSIITHMTLAGDIYGSSAGSRDIISYISLRRDNVEFAKKYIKPTFIPPSEDWLQVIDNGQNSDNSYNYAFKALTNNEGESARNQQVRFEQPGNGNQALYAYVSQDPRDEEYLGGRVNNNGPRTIRLNTIKDENWVGNTDIQSGNYYELGTLAQDAITIETNISVGGTDSSTYTQQVELSNLKFSKSGRPVTISNDPNQTTDYEYHWELYPSAGVPAGFTVNISMLSSDGDNDNGIRLDIIKKNTTVFPIGTIIGTLTLTPKDQTKLPIITCGVYHRYFT